MLALALVTFVLIFLGGGLASDVLRQDRARRRRAATVWLIVRWPAALRRGDDRSTRSSTTRRPTSRCRHFRWITPGAVVRRRCCGSSPRALFFVYVSNFSSYSATYGAFAGAVILLVWLWVTNVVLLFGAELNAVVDLRRSPDLPEGYDGPVLPAKEPADA